MIPYIDIGPWQLGPLTIYPFGIMVGLAILVGAAVGQKRAEKLGLNPKVFSEAVIWMYVGAFAMAHWVSVIFYFPHRIWEDPLSLLKFWEGISSFGGFLGGAATLYIYARIKKLPVWTMYDAVSFGLVHGWVLGRAGCSLAHDHPGKCTNFFLAVKFPGWNMPCPEGYSARHDLGFYEFLFTIFLAVLLNVLDRFWKDRKAGLTTALVPLVYAPVRFILDFLRIGDRRYLGLTPGHYFAIGLFLLGLWILITRLRAPQEEFLPFDFKTGQGGLLKDDEKGSDRKQKAKPQDASSETD
jgi:phosphatidylglycerol:prolipoprotein diacylglycerol transferase